MSLSNSGFDEYDLSQIERNINLAQISYKLDELGLTYKEKKLALGIINYLYCPKCPKYGHQMFQNLSIHGKIEDCIIRLPWMSQMPIGTKKIQCGSCYGLLYHDCTKIDCEPCEGNGVRYLPCKTCATIPHRCTLCHSGYVMIKTDYGNLRRDLCPNIKKLYQTTYCSRCHGSFIGTKKKCYGPCPLLQYTTLHTDNKLIMGCACGRSHQIGDCKRLVNAYTGKTLKRSPYQYWVKKCKYCSHTHPIIRSFRYKSSFRPKKIQIAPQR